MNIDYSQFYRGTTNIPSYGNGIYKKDTLVKYEFNTTDEHGNKVMDKMSRGETLQAMKDIGSQYGDAVIVEFSGDGMAALVENKKGVVDANISQDQQKATDARNVEFQKEITQVDNTLELPAYSGMYGADKAVASAVESIAKLASAGKADNNGNMDYGVRKGRYLGHGSNLVKTTNALESINGRRLRKAVGGICGEKHKRPEAGCNFFRYKDRE